MTLLGHFLLLDVWFCSSQSTSTRGGDQGYLPWHTDGKPQDISLP